MSTNSSLPKKVLLVVDDESSVCRAISRMLRRAIAEIVTATNPQEAETVLRSRSDITHIICDQWFGPGQPIGIDLVSRWRREHRSIVRAIVLTGTDISRIERPREVDHVLPKTVDPSVLSRALLAGELVDELEREPTA